MASTLNADNGAISGSSGLKNSADASGVLALQTNGTTALTIDTSQNVGIGTTSPTYHIHAYGAAGTAATVASESSTNSGGQFLAKNTVRSYTLGVTGSTDGTFLLYDNTNASTFYSYLNNTGHIWYTSSTERMRIDTSGNVGIGTSSPAYKLDVQSATGNTYIRAVRPAKTTGEVGVLLDGGTGGVPWYIYQGTNSDALSFFYAGERMRITSGGDVGIGTSSPAYKLDVRGLITGGNGTIIGGISYSSRVEIGAISNHTLGLIANNITQATINTNGNIGLYGATTTASGVGITFPASQSASSDANCLDDYEEGTWTPTSGGTAGITMVSIGNAVYTKIGRMVHAYAYFQMTSTGVAGANWGGLPFAPQSYAPATRYYSNGGAVFGGNCYVESGATSFRDSGSLPAGTYGVMVSATYFV